MGAERQQGSDSPESASNANGPTPGQILRATREHAGFELNQAARSANLGASVVMAMEADDFATLGLPVYARGYYRRYAKVIGCDPEVVLAAYEHSTDSSSPVPQISQRPSIPYAGRPAMQKALPLIALVSVAAIVVYFFLSGTEGNPGTPEDLAATGAVADQPAPAEQTPPTVAPLPDTRRPVEVDMQEALEKQTAARQIHSGNVARTDDASGLKLSTQLVPPNRLEIVTGPQAAWVEVIDALGEKLVYRVVNPGETVIIEGEPPYSLNLGMAHTLRLRYGGEDLDLQAATDTASRARATIAANGEVIPR